MLVFCERINIRLFILPGKGGERVDLERLNELKKACKGKRARFIEEWIKDRNGTEAAIRAGIPEAGAAVQASRFLRDPAVLAYRDALIEAEAESLGVSKDGLLLDAERLWQRSIEKGDSKGAARALEMKAKLIGAMSEKHTIESGGFEIHLRPKDEGNGKA